MKQSQSKKTLWKVLLATVATLVCLPLAWNWLLTPTINPDPKDVLTITGAFPFDKGYDLALSHQAYTTNPVVNYVCGGFGMVRGVRGISCSSDLELIQPRKVDCCNYEIVLYRDRYLSGLAGWKLSPYAFLFFSNDLAAAEGGVVGTQLRERGKNSVDLDSAKGGVGGINPRATEIVCDRSATFSNKSNNRMSCRSGKSDGPDMYDKNTHTSKINIYMKSEK
jgi:hypothetical protein